MKSESTIYSRYFTYIKPVTKLPIIKNYGPTIFSLLTISLLLYFAVKPTFETILVLQKKLAGSNEVLQKITQKANNLSLGKENYDNMDQTIKDKIFSLIPDTVSIKSVIQTLEQAAQTHEASVSALQIQPLILEPENEAQEQWCQPDFPMHQAPERKARVFHLREQACRERSPFHCLILLQKDCRDLIRA